MFASGWSAALPLFVVKGVWRGDWVETRMAVVAGRSVGGAVRRNRARRRLAEAIREADRERPRGADLVVVARGALAAATPGRLRAEVRKMFEVVETMRTVPR